MGVFMPSAGQEADGNVEIILGAKGVVELELVSSGESWGRGPKHDVHSSLEAALDSPSWHLVQALNTLITVRRAHACGGGLLRQGEAADSGAGEDD